MLYGVNAAGLSATRVPRPGPPPSSLRTHHARELLHVVSSVHMAGREGGGKRGDLHEELVHELLHLLALLALQGAQPILDVQLRGRAGMRGCGGRGE